MEFVEKMEKKNVEIYFFFVIVIRESRFIMEDNRNILFFFELIWFNAAPKFEFFWIEWKKGIEYF